MKKMIALAGSVGFLLMAAEANALESSAQKVTTESVASVWKRVGNFCGISAWDPSVAKCELSADGKQRTMTLKNGATVVEALVKWSDKHHFYTYKIVSSPLPVDRYESTLKVAAGKGGAGSIVTWKGHYEAKGAPDAEAKKIIDSIYESGTEALVNSK
jgi:hypothetical protein